MLRFDITAVVLVACLFNFGDAAITGWSSPTVIGTADGDADEITIAEDTALETEIEEFTATATGGSSVSGYELLTSDTPFTLDTTNGKLKLSTALDFETTTSYTIQVKATETGGTNFGTATVVITVTDVNEAPAFAETSYTVCVTDGSVADTSVATLSATDQDTDDTITYSIASGNTNTDFTVSTTTLQVNTAKTLARATTPTYTLVIEAADNDGTPLTGSATYTVNVQTSCSSGAAALTMTFITLFLALISSLN